MEGILTYLIVRQLVAQLVKQFKEKLEAYFHFWSRFLDLLEYCLARLRISSRDNYLGRIMFG